MSIEKVMHNAETYAQQAFRVLDPRENQGTLQLRMVFRLSMEEFFRLASNFTVQQFLTRYPGKRWDNAEPIYLHEFFIL